MLLLPCRGAKTKPPVRSATRTLLYNLCAVAMLRHFGEGLHARTVLRGQGWLLIRNATPLAPLQTLPILKSNAVGVSATASQRFLPIQ